MAELLQFMCTQWGLVVTAVSHDGESGLTAVANTKPNLILLDIGLPDTDGLILLPQLRRISPASKIIVISALYNDYTLGRLHGLRWDGLIDKIADGIEFLREAIQTVHHGGRYVSPTARRLISRYQQSNNAFSRMLSDREKEVLVCIAHALTDIEIGDRLDVDPSTVHSHRKNLHKKLGQQSTPKLMHFAIRHGYASLPLPALAAS